MKKFKTNLDKIAEEQKAKEIEEQTKLNKKLEGLRKDILRLSSPGKSKKLNLLSHNSVQDLSNFLCKIFRFLYMEF